MMGNQQNPVSKCEGQTRPTYVSSITTYLISLSRLDLECYVLNSGHRILSIYKSNVFIGIEYACDGLYRIRLDPLFASIMAVDIGI